MLRHALICLVITWAKLSFAQEKVIIPPAPNAANLVFNTETQMGLYTGTPQINIPVWTVNAGVLQLPVSLSYTSGGVKVADMASWCGLGWNLNAGGVITRSVLGLPDETPTFGYIDYTLPLQTPYSSAFLGMAEGTIDAQQDLFFYSLPGGAGRFVFDTSGTPRLIPKSNCKITKGNISIFQFSDGTASCISEWQIIDDKGIIYRFRDYEKTLSASRNNELPGSGFTTTGRCINSWYLTEMESPSGEKIKFNYLTVNLAYDLAPTKTSHVKLNGQCENYPSATSVPRQYVNTKRLSSIEFPGGKIRFIPATLGRADLVGDHALDRIIVEDKLGQIIRQFKLDYKYLVGNSLVDYASIDPAGSSNFFVSSTITPPASFGRRLMLMKWTEQDANGVPLNNGQRFDYHTEYGLPHRASPLTDHWGFANKADNPLAEVPYILIDPLQAGSPTPTVYVGGKSPDVQYAKQGSLYRIHHAAGGFTEYEFESNDAAPSPYIPPKVTKKAEVYSISLSHYRYNVDGWYEGLNYEIRPDGNGNMVRNYYVEFKILNGSTGRAQVLLTDVPYYPAGGLRFYIMNVSTGRVIWSGNHDGNFSVYLEPGAYRLYHCPSYALLNNPQNPDHQKLHSAVISGLYTITSEQGSQGQPPKVGGIRVRKCKQYDPVTRQSLYKEYKYEQDGSSGQLLATPLYQFSFDVYDKNGGPCRYLGISYNAVNPLSTTHNSFVGYRYVEEKAVSEAGIPLGKTGYSFMGPLESPDVLYKGNTSAAGFTYYDAPNPPADRRDWLRGYLTQQVDYKYDTVNQSYSPVRKIENIYKKTLEPVSKGLQVNINSRDLVNGRHSLLFTYYSHHSGTILLEKTAETLYQENGVFTTTTTIENSGKSFLPVCKSIVQSDGSLSKEYYTYPKEYAPGNAAIDNLIRKNIVSVPIETVKLKEQPLGTLSITGGSLTNYYPTGWGKVQSISKLETNQAIPGPLFKFSNAPAGQLPASMNATQFAADARYKARELFNNYDAYGNPTEKQKANDVKEVYLWGYNGTYPVAKVVGSDYATVSGLINQSMLDNAGAYTDVQIRAELNKIRTWFASNGQVNVSTYTYAPLIGMTSQTDANNFTTFYEYDSFGRLVSVRDHNNKILKKMEYGYASQ
ncbi:RHS repeat domain-containing protein [Chitinophaga sp. NPDC101104]|uniref:RHS repeat domain-containing protein n=1 Tax=Chitinophaga sp. NPDC101104 TaxID=3390561 RepID=UPI003D00BB56